MKKRENGLTRFSVEEMPSKNDNFIMVDYEGQDVSSTKVRQFILNKVTKYQNRSQQLIRKANGVFFFLIALGLAFIARNSDARSVRISAEKRK